jgi:hypothetical protein
LKELGWAFFINFSQGGENHSKHVFHDMDLDLKETFFLFFFFLIVLFEHNFIFIFFWNSKILLHCLTRPQGLQFRWIGSVWVSRNDLSVWSYVYFLNWAFSWLSLGNAFPRHGARDLFFFFKSKTIYRTHKIF